jgi:acetyl esterase/lipase
MNYQTYDLTGEGRVILKCYLQKWTTTAGHYPKRGAVVVLPGGAYMMHGGSEGEPVALAFLAQGYQAFVLHYSVGDQARHAIGDAARTVAFLRAHAEEWSIAPEKIAVCGFSAGGHVAACLGTMWDRADIVADSGCAAGEGRPNALILGYPCITADVDGAMEMYGLLAPGSDKETVREQFSAEKFVSDKTPPTFLWNIFGDQLVPVEHGLRFLTALAAHDVPFESHTYQRGIHGCALATPATSIGAEIRENTHVARWFTDCCLWLSETFGEPKLDCKQFDIYFPGRGRCHLGERAISSDMFGK